MALGNWGIGTLSGAASSHQGSGYLASASLETEIWGLQWHASTQRTFGDYADIASVTADLTVTGSIPRNRSGAPPRALDQVGVSIPLSFDQTVLNLNFTHLETSSHEHSRIVGA
ncbi:MAG: fimbrial biogenesis outer membrane usher protein, partial [Pseudomonadota bacterium]|nr:fimbrial biogenesis outer membrane usher protein [Pseudomonadota bacterium]